jgi:hypothetical protein
MTYDKSTMRENMMNVHGSDGDEKCKRWLRDYYDSNFHYKATMIQRHAVRKIQVITIKQSALGH